MFAFKLRLEDIDSSCQPGFTAIIPKGVDYLDSAFNIPRDRSVSSGVTISSRKLVFMNGESSLIVDSVINTCFKFSVVFVNAENFTVQKICQGLIM